MIIPDSVISIGNEAFCYCEQLKEIIYKGTREQWNKIGYETNIHVKCIDDASDPSGTSGDTAVN